MDWRRWFDATLKGVTHSSGIESGLSIVLYADMPRKLRIEYLGAMYHIMSRGDRGERIFLDDVEY